MAAVKLPTMPIDAYLGIFIDGDGPIGIIKKLPDDQTAYFRFLPMYLPYVVKKDPAVFVTQFGGGISTRLALRSGATSVTVAESNPLLLQAVRDPAIADMTGHMLDDPHVHVVPFAGGCMRRWYPTVSILSTLAWRIRPASRTPAATRSTRNTIIRAKPWRASCAR